MAYPIVDERRIWEIRKPNGLTIAAGVEIITDYNM
jgi:hypothetical protein